MKPDSRRKLTLLDVMLFVAAFAFAAWFLTHSPDTLGISILFDDAIDARRRVLEGWKTLQFLIARLSGVPATLCVLRLLEPRPSRRVLFRQPGFVACCVWTATLLAIGVMKTLGQQMSRSFLRPDATSTLSFSWASVVLSYHIDECGLSVAAAWLTLALGGRWRPEPSWIDRMGRALGYFSIAIVPLAVLAPYLR
ncbi:hypothetical protein [Paludisphaera soli]|uniref:hypothetical protein n=1 Tax=Paludisphaera soli TaxID=2712865 RepID=UPI0013EA5E91|nr:hypothetical protein [Paludisphaera soli]